MSLTKASFQLRFAGVHACLILGCLIGAVDAQDTTKPSSEKTAEAAAADAQNSKSPPALEFSFREQKWIDVLDWFARQADLSLVVNELPDGTFTYSDTKTYTPTEALDLLNGVLSTRGFSLVRRERMLICANLNKGIPEGLIPRVELDDLDDYGQFELVEVMFPLGKRPPEAVEQEVSPLLGNYGKATVLAQTRQLLVTTTAGQMRAVNAIISSIPEPKPPEKKPEPPKPPGPELRVHPAENVDTRAAVEMIEKLIGGVKMTIDDRTGQINAYATPDQHAAIEKLIEQMSRPVVEELQPKLQVYEIGPDAPSNLVEQLKLVVPEATLSVENDRLTVFATPKQHEAVVAALQTLSGQGAPTEAEQPVVYVLSHIEPTAVASMISELYPRVKVTVDSDSDRLVIVATQLQQQAIRTFIDQLEAKPTNTPTIEYHALNGLDGARVQSVVQSLVPNAQLTLDNDAQRIMAIAPTGDQEAIRRVLQQMVDAQAPASARRLQRYPLSKALRDRFNRMYRQLDPTLNGIKILDAGEPDELLVMATDAEHERVVSVLDIIRNEFEEPTRSLKFYEADKTLRDRMMSLKDQLAPALGPIQTVEETDDRFGVVGTESQHRQLQLLLDELRRELPAEPKESLRIFSVTPTQRSRFISLKSTLDDKLATARIIEEGREDELVVWATPTQLALIEATLPSLKVSDQSKDRLLVVYPLKEGDATSVQNVLTELYPDTKILVEPESRRILVWTDADQHRVIEQAIQQLDSPAATKKERMVYYAMGEIDARDVERLFEQLLPNMSMVSDRDTNSIIAWGSEEDHEILAKTVEDFRSQDAGNARSVVSYSTGNQRAYRIRYLIDDVVPRARVVSDDDNQRVIVWGTEEEQKAVAELMQQIVEPDQTGNTSLKVYTVKKISARDLRQLLEEVTPTAEVSVSDDNRQAYVWATEDQHTTIADAVNQIEAGGDDEGDKLVRVYPLEKTSPSIVTPLIAPELLEETTMVPDESRNVLVIRATEARHTQLAAAIQTILKDLPAARERESRVYRLKHADPSSLQSALSSLAPGSPISVDSATRSLIVAAFPDEHEKISQTISEIDKPQEATRVTRSYRLGSRDFYGLQSALRELVPQATIASDRSSRMILVTASAEDQQRVADAISTLSTDGEEGREIRVYRLLTADPEAAEDALEALLPNAVIRGDDNNRTVLVTASAEDQARAAQVLEQLEAAPPAQLSTQVFKLKHAAVDSAEDAIQAMLPDANVAGDSRNRSLLVTGREGDIARIAEVIKQIDQPNVSGRLTRVYRLKNGDVRGAQNALEDLLPEAVIADDRINRSLIVTASEEDQQRVEDAIEQIDQPDDQAPTLQAYPIAKVKLTAVYEALQRMYDGNDEVAITADETNRAILAKASPRDHQTIAQIVSRMENGAATNEPRVLKVYNLPSDNPDALLETLRVLFEEAQPSVDLSLNPVTKQLVAVATPSQHQVLEEAAEQIQEDPQIVEVFPLPSADPFTIELAIDRLFADQDSPPVANGDMETQQLFVRGTKTQIEEVRQLLIKMGELPQGDGASQRGMRVIPFRGDVEEALRQIEAVWPRLRDNPIRIVQPQANTSSLIPVRPANEIRLQSVTPETAPPTPNSTPPVTDDVAPNDAEVRPRPSNSPANDGQANVTHPGQPATVTQMVAQNDAQPNDEVPAEANPPEQGAPVILVPQGNSVTALSEDESALGQFELLLRAIARQRQADATGSNFAVYSLRNAGASSVTRLLTELLEQMPLTSRSALGGVSLVADERLNAVVVHGRAADREVIAQLLSVLDSSNVPQYRSESNPLIVPVVYLDANQVMDILESVYESQMRSGGRGPELEIPEGVPREVASVLRQINASSSGPLLTLEVDDVTNSIVVLAPRELGLEVQELIQRLDKNGRENDSRDIGIVTLEGASVEDLEPVLNELLRGSRRRRGRR